MTNKRRLGWAEWAALPELKVARIKAKLDTGARTSALHALDITPFWQDGLEFVRFTLEAMTEDESNAVCLAPIKTRREIASSNGDSETRIIIDTDLRLGESSWPIELSLTNRTSMSHRLLIGRSALNDVVIDPDDAYTQGLAPLDESALVPVSGGDQLRIAILTNDPKNYSSRRIKAAAAARGHAVRFLQTRKVALSVRASGGFIHYNQRLIAAPTAASFDAIIPRIGTGVTDFGVAVVRQFEALGVISAASSLAISLARDKRWAHQTLAQAGIPTPPTSFGSPGLAAADLIARADGVPVVVKVLRLAQGKGVMLAETPESARALIEGLEGLNIEFLVQKFISEANGEDLRLFVVGGEIVASIKRIAPEGEFRANLHCGGTGVSVKPTREERQLAIRAAQLVGLDVAGVDILRTAKGPVVIEVNASPGLEGVEGVTGEDVASRIIEVVESKVLAARSQKTASLPVRVA